MYAVVDAGGKQAKVVEGAKVLIELTSAEAGATVELRPLLVVAEDRVVSSKEELAAARVEAEVIGVVKGPKINGFTYKSKANERRRYGHRQRYTQVVIRSIAV